MNSAVPPAASVLQIASSARAVLPEAVGAAATTLWSVSRIPGSASRCIRLNSSKSNASANAGTASVTFIFPRRVATSLDSRGSFASLRDEAFEGIGVSFGAATDAGGFDPEVHRR
jgi:hypothetical protein